MIYIKKILNLITKNGKKGIAVKTVNNSLEKLKRIMALSKLDKAFERIRPSVKIYKKKVAGKVYQIPAMIKHERALFQTAKWVTLAMETEKKGKKLSLKLSKVILDTVKNRGTVLKLRKQYLSVIKENRSYMRFIRRKRKKKKIWLFQQRFTSKIIKKEVKENKKLLLKTPKKLSRVNLNKNKGLNKIRVEIKGDKGLLKNYENNKKISRKNKK